MNRTLPVLVVCASLSACGLRWPHSRGEEVPLSEFTRALEMHWYDSLGRAEVGVGVTLGEEGTPDPCLALRSDVHAELNGMELKVDEPGSNDDAVGHHCEAPSLGLSFPRSMLDGSTGLLVLSDGTGARIEVEIAHLFTAQDIVMTTPQSTVTAGADVALTWTTSGDWNPAAKQVVANFHYAGTTDHWVFAPSTVTGRDIVVHAPTPLPAGAPDLQVTVEPEISAQRCEGGPLGCAIWYQVAGTFPVQVP